MDDIRSLFREHSKHFTVYVVEQKFVVGRGLEYFKGYKGKPNYIDSDKEAKTLILRIFRWINKKIPSLGEMIKIGFGSLTPIGIVDIVIAFSKLFSAQEHQAAGPDALDPIIIQEGKVLKTYINQLVSLHKNSFLAPAIIILLQDNNIERAKELLSECPDGIYIKFIRNNGKTELDKVINTGAENIDSFIRSFSQQNFSTCSNTQHDILLNKEWSQNSLVRKYAPRLLKYRANLLCDEKNEMINYLSECITELQNELQHQSLSQNDKNLLENFLGISKIFRVFCNDYGGKDYMDALSIANETGNEILKAIVYKQAFFFKNKSIDEQDVYLEEAYRIFANNDMADNAIYCMNNRLVRQFDTNRIYTKDFSNMIGESVSDVPGLVGMAHLFNNAGIAFLMTAQPDLAQEYFDRGLDYAKLTDRFVQKIAIQINKLITKSYYNEQVEFSQIQKLMIQIFDGMAKNKKLPFIASRYVMNILIIAMRENVSWVFDLLQDFTIKELFNEGINNNIIGSGQLLMQINYIDRKCPELNIKSNCVFPREILPVTGNRKDFIEKSGLNPFYFFTWL